MKNIFSKLICISVLAAFSSVSFGSKNNVLLSPSKAVERKTRVSKYSERNAKCAGCAIDFGAALVNTWAGAYSEDIEYYSIVYLTFDTPIYSGDPDYYSVYNTCSGSIPLYTGISYAKCSYGLNFVPTSPGLKTASWTMHATGLRKDGSTIDDTYVVNVKGVGFEKSNKVRAENKCGSVISPDSLGLIEIIPVVGCDFNLVYNSENSNGYYGSVPATNRLAPFSPEGWSVSIVHFYDIYSSVLYRGDGPTSTVKAKILGGNYLVVSADGSEVYVFDSNGIHTATKSALTGATLRTFTYNSANQLISIQDAFGNQTIFNRGSSGLLTSIQSPYSVTTTVTTNSLGQISSVQNPNGETYNLTYKVSTDLLATFQKPGGQTSTLSYDPYWGGLLNDTSSAGNFWDITINGHATWPTKITSAQGITTSYQHKINDDGSSEGATAQPTYSRTYSEDASGVATDSAEGVTVATSYTNDERFGSSLKRVLSSDVTYSSTTSTKSNSQTVVWPSGVTADWFNYSTITTGSTVNSQTVTSIYNASTKTAATTTPAGATSSVTFDSNERPTSIQLGSDTAWSYTYDTHGRLSQVIQGTNNGLTYAYNTSGYLQSTTNLRGEVVSYSYDLAGRVTQVTLPDTRVITYSYDANGNLTSVTPPSKPLHGMSFNAMDLISTYAPPALSGLTTKDTNYTYNLDKQLTQITRPTGDTVTFTYDSSSGLLNTTAITAGNFSFTYLSKNRISQASSPDDYYNSLSWYGSKLLGDAQWKTSTNFLFGKASYTYDSQHRVSSKTFRGNATTNTFTRNYTYNNDSQITQAGDLSLTYSYPSGRLSTTSINKISDSRTYDTYGNLQSYTAIYTPTSGSPQTLYSYTLSRDSMGRISGKSETVLGVTDAYTYSYDSAGRLTTVLKNGSAYSSYVYDSNGNRTSGVTAGAAFTATYDDQDRILTYNSRTYSYNANGDLTHIQWSPTVDSSYVYDALGDLRQATLSAGNVLNYSYDGLNRRIRKMDGTTLKYHYIFESGGRISGHVNINGVIQREYIYASDGQVPDYLVASGVNYRLVKDHLGSIRLVVKTDDGTITQRMDYNDLGEAVTDTNAGFQAFGFAGGIYDGQTKLVKFGVRDYDPRAGGRWTSKDPIQFEGGDANLYSYTANDPINWIDPGGTKLIYADKNSERLLKPVVRQIMKSAAGRRLLKKLHDDTTTEYGIQAVCGGNSEYDSAFGTLAIVDVTQRSSIRTDQGIKQASPARLLTHELGHLANPKNSEMENIRQYENPVMEPLEHYNRTSYGNDDFVPL